MRTDRFHKHVTITNVFLKLYGYSMIHKDWFTILSKKGNTIQLTLAIRSGTFDNPWLARLES